MARLGGGAPDFVAVSPDGRHVSLRRPQGGFDVRRTADGAVVRRIEVPEPGYKWATAWSPTVDLLVDAGRTSSFAAPPRTRLVTLGVSRIRDLPLAPSWAFTPDGKAVLGSTPSGLALVDLATDRLRRRFQDASASRAPYAFSPDGRLLASSGEDPDWRGPQEAFPGDVPTEAAYAHESRIKVWRVADGRCLRVLPGAIHEDRLAFVGRHRLLVNGVLFDARSGRTTLAGSRSASYSGNSATLPPLPADPFHERSVRFPDSVALVRMVAASSNGRLLVVPEWNPARFRGATRLLVWDLPARRLLRRIDVHEVRNLNGLGFAAGGRLVLAGSGGPNRHYEVMLDAQGRIASHHPVEEAVGPVGYLTYPSVASPADGRVLAKDESGLALRARGGIIARLPEFDAQFEVGLAALPAGGFAVVRQGRGVRLLDRDARIVATLVAFPVSGWAAWAPAGRAWGSCDGLPRLLRRTGARLVSVGGGRTPAHG